MSINHLSALTQEEFASTYLTLKTNAKPLTLEQEKDTFLGDIDWTTTGAVTPIKDQGQCGSCWAFSTTGALEALSKVGYGTLLSFSEQQLMDCSTSYGNKGCDGGLMNNAFKYVKERGIVIESEYPYTAVKGICTKDGGNFRIAGFLDAIGCTALANALIIRPISVAVDATNWHLYSSGVFSDCANSLNHGVLLVGSSADSWKVKNSWSAKWGENGYIRLARGSTCGICTIPSYPLK